MTTSSTMTARVMVLRVSRVMMPPRFALLGQMPSTANGRSWVCARSRAQHRSTAEACKRLQDELAEVGVLGEVADAGADVSRIDGDGFAALVGGLKRDLVEHPLHHGL